MNRGKFIINSFGAFAAIAVGKHLNFLLPQPTTTIGTSPFVFEMLAGAIRLNQIIRIAGSHDVYHVCSYNKTEHTFLAKSVDGKSEPNQIFIKEVNGLDKSPKVQVFYNAFSER